MQKGIAVMALMGGLLLGWGTTQAAPVTAQASHTISRAYRGKWYGNHQTWTLKRHSLTTNYRGRVFTIKGKQLSTTTHRGWHIWGVTGTDNDVIVKRVTRQINGHRRTVLMEYAAGLPAYAPYKVLYYTRHAGDKHQALAGQILTGPYA